MKRGLKGSSRNGIQFLHHSYNLFPDEKGTESDQDRNGTAEILQ